MMYVEIAFAVISSIAQVAFCIVGFLACVKYLRSK